MKQFLSSVLAGFCITIGCWVNLAVGGPLGAVLFSFGLLTVVHYGFRLYTGTAGFVTSVLEHLDLIEILAGNMIGVVLGFILSCMSPMSLNATSIIEARISVGPLCSGFLAIGCGFIMTTAVKFARQGRFLPLLFGVPVFILCGFPHCIADLFYWISYGNINWWIWSSTVLGNYVGCNLHRVVE